MLRVLRPLAVSAVRLRTPPLSTGSRLFLKQKWLGRRPGISWLRVGSGAPRSALILRIEGVTTAKLGSRRNRCRLPCVIHASGATPPLAGWLLAVASEQFLGFSAVMWNGHRARRDWTDEIVLQNSLLALVHFASDHKLPATCIQHRSRLPHQCAFRRQLIGQSSRYQIDTPGITAFPILGFIQR